jgi:regulatory protein
VKITSIEPQKKNPLRENIFLDGEFAFGIGAELRFLSKLHVNDKVTPTQVEKLIQKDQITRLVEKALRFLSYRPRSEREVRQQLLYKGKLTEMETDLEKKNYQRNVEDAIKFLRKNKMVDDRQFSLWWIEGRRKFKKTGDQVIKQELMVKGVDKHLVEELLSENTEDPFEMGLAAAQKKLISYQKLEPKEFKIKMGQYLQRRGYSWEVISRVVDTLLKKD